ncbi:uncharacterized protein N7458_002791 [Penicillium daleae]|uniref:Integrase catalytic domain-containing protein n=1 Tax=Penicillium daleae TaxID=63821 RepID=A0AAD6CE56_9EURO|nr:uncharacterized protein N7458_002791 [Penicillium daleae]KAJ5461239.1 hypothetical protein N7458_002791 [Penicillium daleae]
MCYMSEGKSAAADFAAPSGKISCLWVFKSDREPTLGDSFMRWIEEEGIVWETSVVGIPEQNGFIERAGGVIIKVARGLLLDSNLPKTLWPLAVKAAGYIINRTLTMLQDGRTVILWVEAMSAKAQGPIRPNLSNLLRDERDVIFDEAIRFDSNQEDSSQLATIPAIDPWGIGMGGQIETESSDEEEMPVRDDEPELNISKPLSILRIKDTLLPTPSPTPSRDIPPVSSRETIGEVPGAFPEGRYDGRVTQERTAPVPAEGVGIRQENFEPGDQLQSELHEMISSDLPEGYRERGTIAPRDITADLSEGNILTGKRTRKRSQHHAAMNVVIHGGQDEDNHEGILLAFHAAMNFSSSQDRPMRDDLPPPPQT